MSESNSKRAPRKISSPAKNTKTALKSPTAKSKSSSEECFFGKFGTFFFDGRYLTSSPEDAYHNLVEKIREDSRVVECLEPEFESNWAQRSKFFPYSKVKDNIALLGNSDSIINLYFPSPIIFEVLVPIKNQPLMNQVDDIPTDRYWVAWDGITLIAIWKRANTDVSPPTSAGHVAEQIIRTAAENSGANLIVQPCNTACKNMFAHQNLRITQIKKIDENELPISCHEHANHIVQFDLNFIGSPIQVVKRIHSFIQFPSKDFARFKNVSQRMMDLEVYARLLIDELLQMDLKVMSNREQNLLKRSTNLIANFFKFSWNGKSLGRESKRIISSLWIIMSRLEGLRLDWLKYQRRFNEKATQMNRMILYDRDRKDDDLVVGAINTQFIRAAVEQKSSRLDAIYIAWATLGGTLIGVILTLLVKL